MKIKNWVECSKCKLKFDNFFFLLDSFLFLREKKSKPYLVWRNSATWAIHQYSVILYLELIIGSCPDEDLPLIYNTLLSPDAFIDYWMHPGHPNKLLTAAY